MTGCVGEQQRTSFATKHDDQSMVPEIHSRTKLRQPDVLPSFLHQQKLDHFVPAITPREHLSRHTKRREILNQMVSLNNEKYGLPDSLR